MEYINGVYPSREFLRCDLVLMLKTVPFVMIKSMLNIFFMIVNLPVPFGKICITGYFLNFKIYIYILHNKGKYIIRFNFDR